MPRRQRGPRAWLGLRPHHARRLWLPWLANFFADRGTHLAAMIAYYALLSLIPLLFLLLAPLQFVGTQTDSSFLIQQVQHAVPNQSVDDIVQVVNTLRDNASTLGLIGFFGLLWSSLGLLSAIASAINIIYEVPNRSFLDQKLRILALVMLAICGLMAGVILITTAGAWAENFSDTFFGVLSVERAFGVLFTSIVTVVFLWAVYCHLPNTPVTSREVIPGIAFATIAFQASFQLLPWYVRAVETIPTLKALGGIVVLLVWFFLMANILLLGAEINWWYGRGRVVMAEEETGVGLA
jgi:membrane protein